MALVQLRWVLLSHPGTLGASWRVTSEGWGDVLSFFVVQYAYI